MKRPQETFEFHYKRDYLYSTDGDKSEIRSTIFLQIHNIKLIHIR